jgi:hypothetical protein
MLSFFPKLKKIKVTPRMKRKKAILLRLAILILLFLLAIGVKSKLSEASPVANEVSWTTNWADLVISLYNSPGDPPPAKEIDLRYPAKPLPLQAPQGSGYEEYTCDRGGSKAKAMVKPGYVSATAGGRLTAACLNCTCFATSAVVRARWEGQFESSRTESILYNFDIDGSGLSQSNGLTTFTTWTITRTTNKRTSEKTYPPDVNIMPMKNFLRWQAPVEPGTLPVIYKLNLDIELQVITDLYNPISVGWDNLADITISTNVIRQDGCNDLIIVKTNMGDKIIKLCNEGEGIRVKVFDYKNNFIGYIAGCYYPDGNNPLGAWGGNDFHLLKDGKRFRWMNCEFDKTKQIVLRRDLYTYDCVNNEIIKHHFASDQEFKRSIDPDTLEGEPRSGQVWWGPPQLESKSLFYQPNPPPAKGGEIAAADPYVDENTEKVCTPGSGLILTKMEGEKWVYSLVGSPWNGSIISPGDTVTIEGQGISGGAVEAPAGNAAYGAWFVKESARGRIVFQAGQGVKFAGPGEGLVIFAEKGTVTGDVTYGLQGNWLGNSGKVEGPVLKVGFSPALMLLLSD